LLIKVAVRLSSYRQNKYGLLSRTVAHRGVDPEVGGHDPLMIRMVWYGILGFNIPLIRRRGHSMF